MRLAALDEGWKKYVDGKRNPRRYAASGTVGKRLGPSRFAWRRHRLHRSASA
jgi:hypothetical protein